jgi:hypothetical protein
MIAETKPALGPSQKRPASSASERTDDSAKRARTDEALMDGMRVCVCPLLISSRAYRIASELEQLRKESVLWTSIFNACADPIIAVLQRSRVRYGEAISRLAHKNLILVQAAGPALPIAPQAPPMASQVAMPVPMAVQPAAPLAFTSPFSNANSAPTLSFGPSVASSALAASASQLAKAASPMASQMPVGARACTPSIHAATGPAPTMIAGAAQSRQHDIQTFRPSTAMLAHDAIARIENDWKSASRQRDSLMKDLEVVSTERDGFRDCLQKLRVDIDATLGPLQ